MQSSFNPTSASPSMLVGSLTFFALGASVFLYKNHAKNSKLNYFVKHMEACDSDTLEEYYFSGFSQLINKEDRGFSRWNIVCLGGANNKVYKVSEGSGNNQVELAVFRTLPNDECVHCYKRLKEMHLGHLVTTQYALIPISYTNRAKGTVSTYLEVSDYLQNGNLEVQAGKFKGSPEAKKKQALQYLQSIIRLLITLQKANIFFSDLKTSNLFVGFDDEIILADIKTLVFCEANQRANFDKPLALTAAYLPPELIDEGEQDHTGYNLDLLQSYQLGISLYEYLTNDLAAKVNRDNNNHPAFNFNHPAFDGDNGILLKSIILDLVAANPKNRFTIARLVDKYQLDVFSSQQQVMRHNEIVKKYQSIFKQANKARFEATLNICKLKDNFYLNDDEILMYRETQLPADENMVMGLVEKIKSKISEYHGYKNMLLDLALQYQSLSKDEKILYWSYYVSIEESEIIVAAFEYLCNMLFHEMKNDYVLSDIFQAFHMNSGRALLLQMAELLQKHNKTVHLEDGKAIQVNYSVKNDDDKKMLTAYYASISDVNLTIEEFNHVLDSSKKSGNPEVIQTLTLQYPNSWSVGIADTISANNKHDFYLLDTCVTLQHEVGHINALLTGEFVISKYCNALPLNLMSYHDLEEYLNIEKRSYAESKIDPIGFKRVGHTGFEFASLSELTFDKVCESILSDRILARREKMIKAYATAAGKLKAANDSSIVISSKSNLM